MPSQILHILFGEDVISGIHHRITGRFGIVADKALEKIQSAYKASFALGCQGPDIFYHNRRTRPVGLEYGSLLHRRGAGIFTAGLLKMGLPDPPPDEEDIRQGRREKGINATGAYAVGFMTHAILDRQIHPYVVYKSAPAGSSKGKTLYTAQLHVFFERILDVLMLKELRAQDISSWDQEEILAKVCENPPLGLRELLIKALVLAFPERAGKDTKLNQRIENAFIDSARFYRVTAPRITSVKNSPAILPETLMYIYPEKLDTYTTSQTVDFLNIARRPWHYPLTGRAEDNRSFPELYSDAVETAVESITPVITGYLETGIFPITEAAKVIGNGGLSIVDTNGKPCAPTFTDPLPLEKVIEEQARIRSI